LTECEIIEKTVDVTIDVSFSYFVMNDVMRIVKDLQPRVASQEFDNACKMRLLVRESESEELIGRLGKVEGAVVDVTNP
jgi:putative IMPACT (imprinted ancient) family translation regulator